MSGNVITVKPSTLFTFECRVTGAPLITIEWCKNGKNINLCLIELSDYGQSPTVRRLVDTENGRYECEVLNEFGSVKMAVTVKVKVGRPFKISMHVKKLFTELMNSVKRVISKRKLKSNKTCLITQKFYFPIPKQKL
ncbi:hypothetical protein B4U80_13809 [Leptotrombidium deliense]|uniref:Ig-like domain-containing protein n=1 Tax=Leptotrombidium deliense TaxID=299467 RepID=A0A443SD84_9ACAR|nr:hypothetical protein B4U80_13809 [Leptotrombidium deliense]